MHYYESECHAKRLICYFQGQGHCESSYDQDMTISTVSFELLTLLLPNMVCQCIVISHSVLQRNWIVVFKVKVTANFKMSMNVCPHDIL